jgi:hypothetical protein
VAGIAQILIFSLLREKSGIAASLKFKGFQILKIFMRGGLSAIA